MGGGMEMWVPAASGASKRVTADTVLVWVTMDRPTMEPDAGAL